MKIYIQAIKVIFYSFFIFNFSLLQAQTEIKGKVEDKENSIFVEYANISLIDKETKQVYTYVSSDDKGNYTLKTDKKGVYQLLFSAAYYKDFQVDISLGDKNELNINAFLKEDEFDIEEVVVKTVRPIKIKKDTIVFNVKSFLKGNEQVVEDLLKNIPGLNIDESGTIKIGNKEVEKVMVENDDFFEKGYKTLTKNMPVQPIEKIELLQNYSNNKLLKGIESSDKVALNLKLKKGAKRVWFGNVETSRGLLIDRYSLSTNLMNFGKKNKYYFLTNLNNNGSDAIGDIAHFVQPMGFTTPRYIGDNIAVDKSLNLTQDNGSFKKSRTNFNNAELFSLNAIFNPTKKLKIKTIGFFNWDEKDFYKKREEEVTLDNLSFINQENYQLKDRQKVAFGKMDWIYDLAENQNITWVSKYNKGRDRINSNLIFNENTSRESLGNTKEKFDTRMTYTNKLTEHKVLLFTTRFIEESLDQNYGFSNFFYQDLFPLFKEADNTQQEIENKLTFLGAEANLLSRNKNGSLVDLKVGNTYRKDRLNTIFSLYKGKINLGKPVGFENQTKYKTNDLYLKSSYEYGYKYFRFKVKLEAHQWNNELENISESKTQNSFFLNPSFSLYWKNKNHRLSLKYKRNRSTLKVIDLYDSFVMQSARYFGKGTPEFNPLEDVKYSFDYRLGDFSDKFFVTFGLNYTKNKNFLSTNTQLNSTYSLAEKIEIKDRDFLYGNANVDYYFTKLSTNLKVHLSYQKSNYKNQINQSDLREIKTANYTYGFALKSSFDGLFNYYIATKWNTNKVDAGFKNKFTNNRMNLDLYFMLNKKMTIDLKSERYFFGNLKSQKNTYYFLDFTASYDWKPNKLSFSLEGNNLLNTSEFTNYAISDIGYSLTQYRLLPRAVLLGMKYSF